MTAPFGVAIIGGGIFVKEEHVPAVLACKLLHLKAIYSRSLKSAKETAALIPAHHGITPDLYSSEPESASADRSLEHLLARPDIHCVIIALPIVAQTEVVLAALRAGKHVLAEKPVAKDIATARALIAAAREEHARTGATLGIAENFRFYERFAYAAQQARELGGPVEHFSVRVMFCIAEADKYYKTEWRKVPEYQGGFLLDAGVHFAAGARMLLEAGGDESRPEHVHAFAGQVQQHLPPMDSVAAIIRTKGGATGIFQQSVGSQCSAFEFDFGYRGGNVKLSGDSVTVKRRDGGEPVVREFPRANGVVQEVQAWAEGLEKGEPNALQTPREAFNDLEFMEKIFRSGEAQGAALRYEFE